MKNQNDLQNKLIYLCYLNKTRDFMYTRICSENKTTKILVCYICILRRMNLKYQNILVYILN